MWHDHAILLIGKKKNEDAIKWLYNLSLHATASQLKEICIAVSVIMKREKRSLLLYGEYFLEKDEELIGKCFAESIIKGNVFIKEVKVRKKERKKERKNNVCYYRV